MSKKDWYRYTDESGKFWRIQTTAHAADIGGLQPTDATRYPQLSALIKPRYIWLMENPRPTDRLRARLKVVIEREHLKNVWGKSFPVGDKEMQTNSYYGEVVNLR